MSSFMTPDELQLKSQWVSAHLTDAALKADVLPFSFRYDGKASADLLATWPHTRETIVLDNTRTQRTESWTDPKSGLEIRCVSVEYADYPAIEWIVYFKNTGKENTPILENLQGIDTVLQKTADGDFVLHGVYGDWCVAEGYAPYQLTLSAGITESFAPDGGRPTNGAKGWPYYNVQMPGCGVLLAIGWPGQWASAFTRDAKNGLHIVAGQELTSLTLKPNEEIRSPLIALVFWQGEDVVRSQNLWRRWFMAHNIPKMDGKPPMPLAQMQLCCDISVGTEGTEVMMAEAEKYAKAGIEIDIYWRDAGWYPCAGQWWNTGTWEVDRQRFPNGFKPIADWIHARGKKLIVWFEPERVGDGDSWLAKNHPEWLLSGTHDTLVDLGNSDARKWVVERVDSIINENGIDYYRQDFNMDPLNNWRNHDVPDRQGVTENFHVQGYLAFWDELQRRHPTMTIDSCASGGRRNDLETMRRAVPLARSDFQLPHQQGVIEGNQGHTYGLSSWLPFQGTGSYFFDAYAYRSFYLPSFGMGGMTPENRAAQQKAYAECRKVAPLMLGDYYPLTPYNLQLNQWIAWQFNRPEQGDGVVQAFRRDNCAEATRTFRLSELDPAAQYELTNFDVEEKTCVSGKALMGKGITVEIKEQPGAAIITYQRL